MENVKENIKRPWKELFSCRIQLAFSDTIAEIDDQPQCQPGGKPDPVGDPGFSHHIQAAKEAQHRDEGIFVFKTKSGRDQGDRYKYPYRDFMTESHYPGFRFFIHGQRKSQDKRIVFFPFHSAEQGFQVDRCRLPHRLIADKSGFYRFNFPGIQSF